MVMVTYSLRYNKDKKRYSRKVHRLLGQTFLDNPENYPTVDHIDRNKTNNNLDNLRWVTIQQNGNNRTDNNEYVNVMKRSDSGRYRVQFTFKDREGIDRTFENIQDAIGFRDIIQIR